MAESALTQLASSGVIGVILVIVLLALKKKDEDFKAEAKARVEDAKRAFDLLLTMQRDLTVAVTALTEIVEQLEADRARLNAPQGRR